MAYKCVGNFFPEFILCIDQRIQYAQRKFRFFNFFFIKVNLYGNSTFIFEGNTYKCKYNMYFISCKERMMGTSNLFLPSELEYGSIIPWYWRLILVWLTHPELRTLFFLQKGKKKTRKSYFLFVQKEQNESLTLFSSNFYSQHFFDIIHIFWGVV